MASRASSWWLFLLAVAFFGFYGLLLYCEWHRLEPIGIKVDFSDGMVIDWVAGHSVAADAGLRAADRILTADARPIRVRGDWSVIDANLVSGRPIALVVERGLARHTVSLVPRPAGSGFWRTRAGIVLVAGRLTQLFALLVAWLMIYRRPADPLARLGAWLLASGGVFSLVLPSGIAATWRALPGSAGAMLWIPFVSSLSVGAILFTFFSSFPKPLFTSRLLWAAAWTPLVVVLGPYLGAFGSAMFEPVERSHPFDATPLMMMSALYAGAGLVALTVNFSHLREVQDRRRVRAILPGSTAALLAGMIMAGVAQVQRLPEDMSGTVFDSSWIAFGTLILLALPISFAYAILSRRMFDLATLLRVGVRYALARRVVLAIPIVLVAILLFDASTRADMTIGELVASRLPIYLPIAALAGLAAWYREPWLAAIDRRFFRQRYDAEQILRGVVFDLRHSGTVEAIAPSLVARLESALHPAFAALMQHEGGGRSFETIASAPAGAAPPPLPAASKVIALARVLGAPLQLGAGEEERLVRGLPGAERKLVLDARIDLIALVPAMESDRELLIALGPKRSEEPYSAADLNLVDGVVDALSLAARRAPEPAAHAASLEECTACGACYDAGTVRCEQDDRPLEPMRMTRVLAARYRLDRRIGEGGMSRLYAAVDLALEREVAVKVLRDEWLAAPGSDMRFRREARLAAALSHPNIITIFDFGVSGRTAFLVMELLHGRTLRDELSERRTLPLPEVLAIVRAVGMAVETAHARGLIHRDLKPENIWLSRSDAHGRVKVLDFGLAKSLAREDDLATGPFLVGTPHYMAPEQLRGEQADPAWDCWALAVMAYELLTGAPPFVGTAAISTATPRHGALASDPWSTRAGPALPDDLQVLEPFFARALSVDPVVRPAGPAALVTALENAAAGVRSTWPGAAWMVWS